MSEASEGGIMCSDAMCCAGKALGSELESVNSDDVLMRGTGYMCRVMYGRFLAVNVYLYASRDGCTVAAYNGTAENP